jgi:hypothetical protein
MPRVGVPRAHLGGGITIQPRLHFVYFDRSVIKTNWNAINRTPLQRAANLIRIIARRSIKRRKNPNLHSAPGQPPYSHDLTSTVPAFKQIYNLPFNFGSSQIIGMVWHDSVPPTPGLHELGGRAPRWVRNKNRFLSQQPRTSTGQFARKDQPRLIRKSVRYPQRPFMVPAMNKAKDIIPKFWRNSLRRKAYIGRSNMGR